MHMMWLIWYKCSKDLLAEKQQGLLSCQPQWLILGATVHDVGIPELSYGFTMGSKEDATGCGAICKAAFRSRLRKKSRHGQCVKILFRR